MLIDSHAHLYAEEFDADREQVIDRARAASVTKILLPNIEKATTNALWNTVKLDPGLLIPMMGLHPCSVKEETLEEELAHVSDELATGRYIAVGEIGMDLYWDKSTRDLQERAFITQCEWAAAYRLPVAIHSREATGELIQMLQTQKIKGLTGVFHCFTGTTDQANQIIDLGFMLGIGGVLTFKNSDLRHVLKEIRLEHLLLETDAPYLAPAPHRGRRNESAYTALVAESLAAAMDTTIENVARTTTTNAMRLFKLKNVNL